jgi:hypothetical protein
MTLDYLDDRLTVTFKGCGWAHSQMMLRMRLKSKQGGGQYMISHSKAKSPQTFVCGLLCSSAPT